MAVSFCGKRIFLTRSCIFKTTKRKHGYIILLPEIGEDLPEKNPLLKDNGLPEFNTFTIERSIATIGKQTVEYEQEVRKIEEYLQNTENVNIIKDVLHPLEEVDTPMETTWGITKALYFGNQSLMPTKYYERIHSRMMQARGLKFTSKPIYHACKAALENKESNLTDIERRAIALFVLEGKLNGLEVEVEGKRRFEYEWAIKRIRQRRIEFREKLQFVTRMFNHTITNQYIVKDFPEDFLKIIAADPSNPNQGPWKITLDPHIAIPFMELCPARELRWKVWHATVSRCTPDEEDHMLLNSQPLEDIRNYRITQAKEIGYKSFSHMSMETKMAGSLENVYSVMDTLLQAARPAQEEEFKELTEFAKERGFESELQEWDVDYWARKHRRSTLKAKDEFLRDFFPLPKVLSGLFELVERLFQIHIVENRKADIWHADVRLFDIIDLKISSTEPIANFYLDPYARRDSGLRMEKDAGWMVAMRNRSVLTSTKPLAALIFNFQPPINDKPSLLSFKDVAVLFQKLGHALQHLLTQAQFATVAGTSNVEWDAVGISGHFLQNWLYEPSVMRRLSSHYGTSEPLPDEVVNSLKSIRSHMAGWKLCKQLYLGKFDLQMHELNIFWEDLMKPLWKDHFVYPLNKLNGHVCSWSTIFTGDFAAAYYSDLWATMVASDAYSAFQEISASDEELVKETANRYRETFLSLGGSVPASEVFRRFRGRDPNPEALLKNLGLITKTIERIE